MIVIKSEELNSYINALLNKSEEAYLMSIEIINKPTINYRTEGFCFFICNAWELLLKAYLINKAKDLNTQLETLNKEIDLLYSRWDYLSRVDQGLVYDD